MRELDSRHSERHTNLQAYCDKLKKQLNLLSAQTSKDDFVKNDLE